MVEWIQRLMSSLGYPGIAILMFLENVFPPIPSELIMPLAGFISTQGDLTLLGVIIAGTLGSVLGALPLYYLGSLAGEARLKQWADRYGKWLAVSSKDISKADDWFDRHGGKAVFIGRLVPGIRSLISIPAGMSHMPVLPFLLYTALGAVLWTTMLAYAGRLLGENYEQVNQYLGPASVIVLVVCVVGAGVWVVRRRQQRGVEEHV